jgi:predicted ATPase
MGGIGKSRLAIQAANEQLQVTNLSFKDGVYLVTLDALTSSELIPSSIAEALSLELQGQEDTLSQVKRFIGKKHILLLLDNYEHLMAEATLTSKLLEACLNLKLLVTSRERLNVEEEWVLTLDGLAIPTSTELSEAERFDALHLFVQRAKRAMLEFSLTQETLPHALKICQLVEGSPLGIELAAVWVKTLPVSEIAKEIESNLNILEAPTKNIAERHQSIKAAFEHSWKLLSEKEQEVLRKLSVFVGGFRREAASEVAGATLPILASLVDKSLLRVSDRGRYDRHSLLYQFMQAKLSDNFGERTRVQDIHGQYFLCFVKELAHSRNKDSFEKVDEELQNIHTAVNWATDHLKIEELKNLSELSIYYETRAKFHEGAILFTQVAKNLFEYRNSHSDVYCTFLQIDHGLSSEWETIQWRRTWQISALK